jgi:hypothetical protein
MPEVTKQQLTQILQQAIQNKNDVSYQQAIIEFKDKARFMWQAVKEAT